MKKIVYAIAAAIGLAAAVVAGNALAASAIVERAKSECVVGEQADGYLGVVAGKTASEALQREVRSINQQRKAAYARIAQQNGVTIEVTAAVAAEKLIRQAPSGQCVRDVDGTWLKKP